jgi:YVTN family beta-propeller protein
MKPSIVAIGLGLFLAGTSIARAQGGAVLLVANKQDSTLTFVDLASGRATGTAATGYHPHEVAVSPDGRTAFVSNYGAGDSVSVIDVAARRELRKIDLGPGRDPHGLRVSRDGTRLYVTAEGERAVLEIDVATEKVLRTFKTGQEVSHMVALAPDGGRLYTANIRNGTVTVLDLDRGVVVAQIAAGPGCEGIDVTPDGGTIWTANKYADTVSVIDAKTLTVAARLPRPGRPIRVKITPDGRTVLVSCAADADSGGIIFFDVATRREVGGVNAGPVIGLVIDPAGRTAYAARADSDSVLVIDLRRRALVGTIAAGHGPDGLAIAVPR